MGSPSPALGPPALDSPGWEVLHSRAPLCPRTGKASRACCPPPTPEASCGSGETPPPLLLTGPPHSMVGLLAAPAKESMEVTERASRAWGKMSPSVCPYTK